VRRSIPDSVTKSASCRADRMGCGSRGSSVFSGAQSFGVPAHHRSGAK
jgi:hypothetical protein